MQARQQASPLPPAPGVGAPNPSADGTSRVEPRSAAQSGVASFPTIAGFDRQPACLPSGLEQLPHCVVLARETGIEVGDVGEAVLRQDHGAGERTLTPRRSRNESRPRDRSSPGRRRRNRCWAPSARCRDRAGRSARCRPPGRERDRTLRLSVRRDKRHLFRPPAVPRPPAADIPGIPIDRFSWQSFLATSSGVPDGAWQLARWLSLGYWPIPPTVVARRGPDSAAALQTERARSTRGRAAINHSPGHQP